MRLLSATLRNYRLHGDLTVEFDPGRNLIGGPNESGKSTLAEAIHRALFFRHRSAGEPQRAMKSEIHNGHPEVALVFEADGQTWTLEKRFSGSSGTARLTSGHGASLQGDEAEEKLAELTGNAEGTATTPNQLTSRWAHLWVWQGTAGSDATTHTAAHRDELVQRLQEQGLAAVMQSDTDERAREKIRVAYENIFTSGGKVKANTRLDHAAKQLTAAEKALDTATTQKDRLKSAVAELDSAKKILAESESALPSKHTELAAAQATLTKADELKSQLERETQQHQAATATRKEHEKTDRQIRAYQGQAEKAQAALAPTETELETLTAQEAQARETATAAETDHRRSGDAVRSARQRFDLATACLARLEKSANHRDLAAKATELVKIQSATATDREALAKLPALTPAQLETLRKLETRIDRAESALNAIAAGIELLASDQPVLLDGHPLESGTPQVITETAEISLGKGTRLRIQPGGGTSLAEARRELENLRKQRATQLDQLAIPDLDTAATILVQRQTIEQAIAGREKQMTSLGGRDLTEKLAAAKDALDAAIADTERRLASLPADSAPALPDTPEAARAWVAETREALQKAENTEQTLQIEADTKRSTHQNKQTALQQKRESLEIGRRTLADLENSARTLEKNYGEATTRTAAIAEAKSAEATARAALKATTEALAALNPEHFQKEITRLTRVIENEQQRQEEARTQLAVARTTLALDGTSDPEGEHLQAKARLATALETHHREQRHANSIALLHRLFSESQVAISTSVTQPIADRVTQYLECLFGRGVRIGIDLNDPAKPALHLTRPDGPAFSFDSLSGGAKEQVAAAVRLATAEILAANHGGTLPIVFDDAFAYADDTRIQSLQSMLDLAATRGLQLLVLTCTPADYIGLGAKETSLTPHQ